MAKSLMLALLANLAATTAAAEGPVRTEAGLLQGRTTGEVTAYKGVPFAAAPVGPLRWAAPAPVPRWQGVREASAFAPACMQNTDMFAAMGQPRLPVNEDCLYLNVWTPAHAKGQRLPVMVWIHGGGFTTGGTGAPMFDGSRLAGKGVVVVSIAYRLGAFGFLATRELSAASPTRASGALGVMDQVAGLKWVRRNIAAFGGDPAKVTIFGESAGAMSVSALASSPAAVGTFRAVIAQSGAYMPNPSAMPGAPGTRYPLASAEEQGERLLHAAGATSLAAARALPAARILQVAESGGYRFAPVADDVFMVKDPAAPAAVARYKAIPILVGFNSEEGALFVPQTSAAAFRGMVTAQYGAKAPAVLAAYPAGSDAEALRSARRLFGEANLVWPVLRWAKSQAANGGTAYGYYFDHAVPHPDVPAFRDVTGAFHGADLAYVFGVPTAEWKPEDRAISDMIIGYWTDFAKTGDPNGGGRPAWPRFTTGDQRLLEIGLAPHPVPIPFAERLSTLD